LAVTVLALFMVTVHLSAETASQPVQPEKMESRAGVAVSVTTAPLSKAAEHVPPQLIPAGLEVTLPLLSPRRPLVFPTLSATRTVKVIALVAVPAGVVTLSRPVVAPAGTVA